MKKLNIFLSLIFFGWVFLVAFSPVQDSDIWFNLKTGEQILKSGSVLNQDIFSFTREHFPWVNRLWLFQLLAYTIHLFFSWNGLVIAKTISFLSIFGLFLLPHARKESYPVLLFFACFCVLSLQFRMSVRPEVVSYLFLSIFFVIMARFLKRKSEPFFFLLPVIILFWVNMHGFFVLGFVIYIAAFLELILSRKGAEIKRLCVVTFLSTCALWLNPFGSEALLVPWRQFQMLRAGSFFTNIQELIPTISFLGIANYRILFFSLTVLLIALFCLLGLKTRMNGRVPVFSFCVFFIFAYLGLTAIRNTALFAIAALFLLGDGIEYIKIGRKQLAVISSLCFFLIFGLIVLRSSRAEAAGQLYAHPFGGGLAKVNREMIPACDFIEGNGLFSKFWSNNFRFSNYYLWRFGPEKKVFWDGRLEIYGEDFMQHVSKSFFSGKTFVQFLDEYQIEVLCFGKKEWEKAAPKGTLLERVNEINESEDWRLVFYDSNYLLFVSERLFQANPGLHAIEGVRSDLENGN